MNVTEQALQFDCHGDTLLGILSLPANAEQSTQTGVVMIVGGPQYRIGAHRQFVLLARAFANAGYPCLRFDYRGMGDSAGEQRHFENIDDDIAAAIAALKTNTRVEKIVLWGLCDAVSAAMLYCNSPHPLQPAGLCLLNPWVRNETSLAQTQLKHYYRQRILQVSFWKSIFDIRAMLAAVKGVYHNLQQARTQSSAQSFVESMARTWRDYHGDIFVLTAGNDMTGQEFLTTLHANPSWQAPANKQRALHNVANADHTFSNQAWRTEVTEKTLQWLSQLNKK